MKERAVLLTFLFLFTSLAGCFGEEEILETEEEPEDEPLEEIRLNHLRMK